MKNEKKLGVYIHIPFCTKKCSYCDFISFDNQFEKEEMYIDNLVREIENFESTNYIVDTIFIGGGTPSVLSVDSIKKIGVALKKFIFSDDLEFTVECNPCSASYEVLVAFKNIGVNRISFGLQSFNDRLLKKIGRVHNKEIFTKAYYRAREIGIKNINIDLMFNLPTQSFEEFKENFIEVIEFKPEHISAYGLIIEENTPFYDMIEEGELEMPSEELDRNMYEFCENYLKEYGYNKYEISNFAKSGYECKHNVKYWKREDYIGFGLNSHSMLDNVRFCNSSDLKEYLSDDFYLKSCNLDKTEITLKEQIEEYIFLGLRLTEGINIGDMEKMYNIDFEELYKDVLNKLLESKLITLDNGILCLTKEGTSLSNYVMSEFLL